MTSPSISYLGAPYSHPDEKVRKFRLDSTSKLASRLFNQGRFVYSPLTHNISLSYFGNETTFETWGTFDLEMLSRCDELLVYKLPGWQESKGLLNEINFAKEHNIPITYITYNEQKSSKNSYTTREDEKSRLS